MKRNSILDEIRIQYNSAKLNLPKGIDEQDFKKLQDMNYNKEDEIEQQKETLYDIYMNIVDLLKKYLELDENDYPIIATWIIGTYFHKSFHSYPYLFLNAMKGSGKTRTLTLITDLAYEGEITVQPTEAVLFRTKGTLGIDEAENLTRKGTENLRELLNACYKKGAKVKRMKQKKTENGTEQVVEEFEIYRPLALANINGMEDVLGDRCINIILERSNKPQIVKLAEAWKYERIYQKTKEMLNKCSLCSVYVVRNLYTLWNDFIINYINNTNNTNNNTTKENNTDEKNTYIHLNNTNYIKLFKKLAELDLTGREVELSLPLLYISYNISPNVYEKLHQSIKLYMKERKQDQFNESRDIMLIDMVSQEIDTNFIQIKDIVRRFLEFTQEDNHDNEINPKWMGRALKRLKLIKDKRRVGGGVQVTLNVMKAQEKIKQFK